VAAAAADPAWRLLWRLGPASACFGEGLWAGLEAGTGLRGFMARLGGRWVSWSCL